MELDPFYGKGPHLLLWAGSQATSGKIPNRLKYYEIFIVYTQFTMWLQAALYNLASSMRPTGCGLETHV
jgi:hypothetical protein